jgi:DNA-binding response OmpR family regulator
VLGALTVYAGEPRMLQGEAVRLIEKLASNLAYALDVIQLEARHLDTEQALSVSEGQLKQASMKVLYMSGYADNPSLREEALRTGIDLLEKPFSSAILTAKVRDVLDRPVAMFKDLEDRLDVEAVRAARKEPGTVPYEEVRRKAGLS